MKYQKLIKTTMLVASLMFSVLGQAFAQNVEQVRWKSEAQVREILGEPKSVTPPVGTHATYTMWRYENFTVAFANGKAFHLFGNDSLRKLELDENRANNS